MFNNKIKTSDFIHVMVTNRCNRHCPFCFDENRKFGKDITIENFYSILIFSIKYKTVNIFFVIYIKYKRKGGKYEKEHNDSFYYTYSCCYINRHINSQ